MIVLDIRNYTTMLITCNYIRIIKKIVMIFIDQQIYIILLYFNLVYFV